MGPNTSANFILLSTNFHTALFKDVGLLDSVRYGGVRLRDKTFVHHILSMALDWLANVWKYIIMKTCSYPSLFKLTVPVFIYPLFTIHSRIKQPSTCCLRLMRRSPKRHDQTLQKLLLMDFTINQLGPNLYRLGLLIFAISAVYLETKTNTRYVQSNWRNK